MNTKKTVCQFPGCGKEFIGGSPTAKYCEGPHYAECANPDCPHGRRFMVKNPKRPARTCCVECAHAIANKHPRICELEGCTRKARRGRKTCCNEHSALLRKTSKNYKHICEWPGCGKEFTSESTQSRFCHADHYSTCVVCGKKFKVDPRRPARTDSLSCAVALGHTEESNRKRKENSRRKWGVDDPLQSEEVKNKIRKTFAEHPEKDYRLGSPASVKNLKDKYGVNNASKLSFVNKKKRETLHKHYGVDNPMHNDEIKRKLKNTMVERGIWSQESLESKPSKAKTNDDHVNGNIPTVSILNKNIAGALEDQLNVTIEFEQPMNYRNTRADMLAIADNGDKAFIDINPTISHNALKSYLCARKGCNDLDCKYNTPNPIDYQYKRARRAMENLHGAPYLQFYDWDNTGKLTDYTARALNLYPEDTKSVLEINKLSSDSYILTTGDTEVAVLNIENPSRLVLKKIAYLSSYKRILPINRLLRFLGEKFNKTEIDVHVNLDHYGYDCKELENNGARFIGDMPMCIFYNPHTKDLKHATLEELGLDVHANPSVQELNSNPIISGMFRLGYYPVFTSGNRVYRWNA